MLEAGVRLVAEEGLKALTLGAVGKAAGFSRGLPAHHFGSKRAYEEALIRFLGEEYQKTVRDLTQQPGLTGLTNLISQWFEQCFKDPLIHCSMNFVLAKHGADRNTDPQIAKLREATIVAFIDQITQGIQMGEIRKDVDPAALALLLIAAICGVLEYSLTDKSVDPLQASKELVDLTLRGIRA